MSIGEVIQAVLDEGWDYIPEHILERDADPYYYEEHDEY